MIGIFLLFSVISLVCSAFALSLAFKHKYLIEQFKISFSELGLDFHDL